MSNAISRALAGKSNKNIELFSGFGKFNGAYFF
jgi:hypothetical protein